MLRFTLYLAMLVSMCLVPAAIPASAQPQVHTENVVLVTLDGLRWQELFQGADPRLLRGEDSTVRDPQGTKDRFWHDDRATRRERLMPFMWQTLAREGQIFGDPEQNCTVRVTNGKYFSYPGYNEILTGFADDAIDSNAKRPNANVTVLEWLARQEAFHTRVAATCSWDVFPFIVNVERSGISVNAPWQALSSSGDAARDALLRGWQQEMPRVWPGVRFDYFTYVDALHLLRTTQPRVLFVALGETDDWAHDGRYDLYLDAAYRNDQYIAGLWAHLQSDPHYAGKTSLIITTDHGRGDIRDGWKNHGAQLPGSERIWIAVLGPDTPALGVRRDVETTQAQVAASVAELLGLDYVAAQPKAGRPLPGIRRD